MGTSLQVTPSYEDETAGLLLLADVAATSATGPTGVTTATDHMPTACTDERRGRLSPQRLPSLQPTPKLVHGTSTAATTATPGLMDTDTTATDPTTADTTDTTEDKCKRIETLTNIIQHTRGHSVYNKDT